MSPTPKAKGDQIIDELEEKAELRDELATVFLHGIERMAQIQKQGIDLAVQQNTELVDMLKKAADKMPGAPRLPMLDLAAGAVTRYAETQKSVIDYFVEQSQIWNDAFKDRIGIANNATQSVTNVAKQAVERSFAVQKKALENTAAQTKAIVDAAKNQFGFTGKQAEAMTDTFQRGVDTLVEAQKELLNLVTH
jgi:hypothetical protein